VPRLVTGRTEAHAWVGVRVCSRETEGADPMDEPEAKTIREWRTLRGLPEVELAERVGTGVAMLRHWEDAGYDPTAQCGLALATALQTPVDTILYGRYVRGFTLPGYQFILAARGRDDWGWKARIVEWGSEKDVGEWFLERANAGWLTEGATATEALDGLEQRIREWLGLSRARNERSFNRC
jgi:transcriptional regulator with XRE-family HTH domain